MVVINGENKNKAMSEEKKESEEQVPTRDSKEALVKIGSPGESRCREELAREFAPSGNNDTLTVY